MRIISQHADRFPGGLSEFLQRERTLVQANSSDYVRIISKSVRTELETLQRGDPSLLLSALADVLDQLAAYRNLCYVVADAHPTALEKIEEGDTASMIEFVATVGKKAPLTEAEFQRFLELSREGWKNCSPQDTILRGRIVMNSLGGKSALLQTWIRPFVRQLAQWGLLSELTRKFVELRRMQKATPQTSSESVRDQDVVPRNEDTQMFSDSDTSTQFMAPLATPEPKNLGLLRDYLRCRTIGATLPLAKAIQIAQAQPENADHHLHILRVFREEGWVMLPRGKREPIFEKQPSGPGMSPSAGSGGA
jgi:hypothetical protein